MRLKEAKLCCAFSWSPAGTPSGLMIATGSVAGAMDEDFNSEAYLEIRSVDVHDTSSHELPVVGRTLMTDRVFRIDWSPHGGQHGMIAGCFTDGSVHVWSVDVMLENFKADPTTEANDPVLCRIEAHNGACRTLQFSPSQPHFLASGGQDKELKIWTLQDPKEPAVVPALTKASHPGEITDVKWNPKFSHILATATATGAVCVWDLKARRTALSFNVSANMPGAANCLAWHPDVSTHLAVARDDVSPVIQLWDLKKAMAPIRELRGHTKGITGMSWNSEDPSLLLSCGCDGRTICWNPTTGDLLGELPVQDNWIYEVQWCPKATAVLASASFESSLGVFSAQEIAAGGSGATRTVPKWLKRPCGATFGFGGRIAAPIKGSNNVSITITTRGDATSDKTFRESLLANPARTPERLELLKTLDFQLVAASEASALAGNREPLLNFLDIHPQQIEEAVDQIEAPFHKDEDEFEDMLVQCIVSGRIAAGVKLCIAANRLDDAFAVAQLASQPSELTTRVVEQYVAVGRLRFAKYLKAVLCNAYEEVVQDAALPWREVLALLATFLPPDRFGPAADALGKALDARKEQDGAAAAFVCSANVDAVADLYQNTFAPRKLVQLITVLEQTVGRACGATSFAQSLSQYATALANAGDFEGALLLSNRAAQLGDVAAAVVADRIQYHVPSAAAVRVGFPFTLALVPDATSIECHMLASKQQATPTTTAQQQLPPAVPQANASPAQREQAQRFPQQQQQRLPQHQQQQYAPQQQQAAGPGNSGYQGQQQQQPAQQYQGQQPQQQYGAQQAQQPQQPPQHMQQPNYSQQQPPQPFQQPPQLPQQPQQQQPQQPFQQPPQQPLQQPPQQPLQQPPQQPPQPQVGQPNDRQTSPPIAAPPQQQYRDPSAGQAPPQPQQTNLPPPTTVQPQRLSPNVSSGSLSRAGSQPSAPLTPAAIASFDVSTLANPTHQGIARGIIDGTAKVTDKRKRDAIEKSAMELFERLRRGVIADGVAELILAFVQSVGTPTAKDNWRKLSDAHYDVVQHFLNIKFL